MARTVLTLPGDVELLTGDSEGPRRFRMVGYTGQPVDRLGGPMVIDLDGIKAPKRLPILLNHHADSVVGFADDVQVVDGRLELSGVLASTEHGQMVARLSDEGYPWTASVGIAVNKTENLKSGKVNGRDVSGVRVVRQSRLFETSFVTAGPADGDTEAQALTEEVKATMDIATLRADHADLLAQVVDEERANLRAMLAAFPERVAFAVEQYLAGKSLVEAQAAEASLLRAELAAERQAKAEAAAKAVDAEHLAAQARHPGVGFVAAEHKEPEQAAGWDSDEQLRAAFHNDRAAYDAYLRAEGRGQVRQDTLDRIAAVMKG